MGVRRGLSLACRTPKIYRNNPRPHYRLLEEQGMILGVTNAVSLLCLLCKQATEGYSHKIGVQHASIPGEARL